MPSLSVTSRLADEKYADHARWIGVIIANWSILESELEGIYRVVLGLDYDRSKINFYAIQNWVTKRDIISATLEHLYPATSILKDWKDVQSELKKATEMRNNAAHAIWAESPINKTLQMRRTHSQGVYSRPKKSYSVNNLRQNAQYIAAVAGKLNLIQQQMRPAPPPPASSP